MTFNLFYQQLLKRQGAGFGAGPKNFKALLSRLGNPHLDYPILHVAGTNGKGSVCHLTACVLHQAHQKTGLFISPHLFSACERISVDGKSISKKAFVSVCQEVLSAEEEPLNFFEILTAAAFLYFSRQKVDYAVLETGLGGRKDPTNVCRPVAAVITSIGLDHCNLLGNTLTKIAREKAGIIKKNTPVFTSALPKQVQKTLARAAQERQAPLIEVKPDFFKVEKTDWTKNRLLLRAGKRRFPFAILGEQQAQNAAVVYSVCRYLGLCQKTIEKGFAKVKITGRFEVVAQGKKSIIFDGAHNPQAVENLLRFYKKSPWYGQAGLVCGFMQDKDYAQMLRLFSAHFKNLYITAPSSSRAASLSALEAVDSLPKNTRFFASAAQALQTALQEHPAVVVSGSFYLVAQLRTRVGA